MAVLKNNATFVGVLVNSMLAGAVGWCLLLIVTASQLATTTGQLSGRIGPLELFELSKNPLNGGGFEGGLQLNVVGVVVYICLIVTIGVVIRLFSTSKKRN